MTKWIDIETIRLNYLRNDQKKLRRDLYKGLIKACSRAQAAGDIGKAFVLPATHPGSPRQMFELYQDAMAIVCKFGKPDLFITFTCNPKWREIQENLRPGETAWDRPDLICRVFKLKLDEFLNDLFKKNVVGKVKAAVHVIEFQKRGLPHCHCLLILEDGDKLRTPDQIDRCIWAEIPDKNEFAELHDRVLKHMIHMPCHTRFRKCKPGRGDQCTKRFPKAYQDQTVLNEDSYPLYMRRKQASVDYFYGKTKLSVTNRYVVPYNPYLLLKYNAHVNVEMCNTVTAVKYLYKYIYKGWDKSVVELHGHDEITRYENCRYVSSIEAFWRIKENFKMHGRFPYVERLPIHVEDGQEVTFKASADLNELKDKLKKDTKLTAWFKLNDKHPEFSEVTYFEIPKYCTWNNSKKQWIKRSQDKLNKNHNQPRSAIDSENKIYEDIVVRTHNISPQEIERFYLKAVLKQQPGAKSFKDLRTVNGKVCQTFQETASHLGLIADDQIWIDTLNEATTTNCNSYKLVRLFAYMLIHCPINEPGRLWDQFKAKLTHNFKKYSTKEQCEHEALIHISEYLNEYEKKLCDYQLPEVPVPEISFDERFDLPPEERLNLQQQFESLTDEQKTVFAEVREKLIERQNNGTSKESLMFIDARGGSGKTYLLNIIIKSMLNEGHKVLPVAFTGIAAVLLHNGRTAHSTFRLPLRIGDDESPVCDIKRGTARAKFLQSIDLIVFDEISMTSNRILDCLDRTLRDLCEIEAPFGNKILLFAGDYRQILPIVEFGTREEITAQIAKNSYFWSSVKKFKLSKNFRLDENDESFDKYQQDAGLGRLETNADGEVELPPNLIFRGEMDNFVDLFFGTELKEGDYEKYMSTSILAPLNEDVHTINRLVLTKLKSDHEERIYLSSDTICPEQESWCVPVELLNTINQSGLPLHRLELKTGAIAFLMRNIDQDLGLCNGTRIVISELGENVITAKVITGKSKGITIQIPRFTLFSDERQGIRFARRQFPIKLAFAITINKSQGQGFDAVGVYLKNSIFSHGHFYVCLSRARNSRNLKFFFDDPERSTTPNIVYPEVFDEEFDPNDRRKPSKNRTSKTSRADEADEQMEIEIGSNGREVDPEQFEIENSSVCSTEQMQSLDSDDGDVLSEEEIISSNYPADLQTLSGTNWLDDSVIDSYFALLMSQFPSVHCLSCFFYKRLSEDGYDKVRRWTKNVDLFSKDLILIPIHMPSHWTLIAIRIDQTAIEYYDSQHNSNDSCLNLILEYLRVEYRRKRHSDLDEMGLWSMTNVKEIPKQFNGYDCGPFICRYALSICKGEPFTFQESDLVEFRKQMYSELSSGKINL